MATSAAPTVSRRTARTALYSSVAGTTIEWYEFFLYGTAAALIFGDLFFPSYDTTTGTLLSLSTFAVAFIARPLGAMLFGHFGDQLGRKGVLVVTLTMMGGSTFLIGCLPTYESIGVLAPVILIALRIIQGLSLGGEYSGAVLLSIEHAKPSRRGLYGGLLNTAYSWGLLLANILVLAASKFSGDSFSTWGWRLPFLFSAVLVAIALFIRLRVEESPEFDAMRKAENVRKAALPVVLRHHLGKIILMALAYCSAGATFYLAAVYSLGYGEGRVGIDQDTMLIIVMVAILSSAIGTGLFGWLSDRTSLRAMYVLSCPGMAIGVFIWFAMFNTANPILATIGLILLLIPFSANAAAMPALFAKVFNVNVRYTGMAVGYTLGTILSSALAPMIATYLLDKTDHWSSIAIYAAVLGAVSAIASYILFYRGHSEPDTPIAQAAQAQR